MQTSNLFEDLIFLLACSVHFVRRRFCAFSTESREVAQIVGGQNVTEHASKKIRSSKRLELYIFQNHVVRCFHASYSSASCSRSAAPVVLACSANHPSTLSPSRRLNLYAGLVPFPCHTLLVSAAGFQPHLSGKQHQVLQQPRKQTFEQARRLLCVKLWHRLVWRCCYAWQHRVCSWPYDGDRCDDLGCYM